MARIRHLYGRYREMATDVVWSGASDFLVLAVSLLSFILLGSTLDVGTYGGFIGVSGVIGPLSSLTWSGLTLLILQRIIREGDSPEVVAGRSFTLTFAQGVAAVVVATLIGSRVISTLPTSTILLMAIAELLVFPITQVVGALVQATRGFAVAARIRMVVPLVRLAALLVPYSMGRLTVRNLAIGWIVGFCVMGIAVVLYWLPSIDLRLHFRRPTRRYVGSNLELSLPLTAANLQTAGDKAVLNSYGLEVDAGLYGAAFRIISFAHFPMRTMNQALFQRFLPDVKGDAGQHVRRAKRFTAVSFAMGVVIGTAVFICAPWLEFLVGEKFSESVTIVRWLVPVIPLMAISRAPLNGLLGLGRTGVRAAVILTSAALSMTLYIVLIPSLTWKGAAIGTFVGEAFITTVGWVLLLRYQRRADAEPDSDADGDGPGGDGGDDDEATRPVGVSDAPQRVGRRDLTSEPAPPLRPMSDPIAERTASPRPRPDPRSAWPSPAWAGPSRVRPATPGS